MQPAEFDFFSPDFHRDPFPYYARMRAAGVCKISPMGFHAVSRHADVQYALRATDVFSSSGFTDAYEPAWLGYNPGLHSMLTMDPPDHTKLRVLVNRAFAGSAIARVEPLVRRIVAGLVDDLARREEADIVEHLGVPLTAGVVGHFLGLDPAVHGRLKRWTDALLDVTPEPRDAAHAVRVIDSLAELQRYAHALLAERRNALGDDLISTLLRAEVDGHSLDDRALVAFFMLLIIAGVETTINLISKGALKLAERPDLHARLRDQPALVPRFVEEMLRWDPPTHTLFRLARKDVSLGDHVIPAGSLTMVMLAAANRDPAAFPDPDTFDLDRETHGHVAFGHGAHLCIGLGLARLEGRVAFEALTARFARLERTSAEVPVQHTMTVRAVPRLDLRLIPA
jgi:cytochrome P450